MEVAGRWFGVRGRRFVRPTLTLVQKGSEIRALAELEHKPWAAEDGQVWTAAFSVDRGLDGAREIELSVAPDITVELRPKGKRLAKPGAMLDAGPAMGAPRFKEPTPRAHEPAGDPAPEPAADPTTPRRRRSSPDIELERLGARLATANHALEQERERRAALARTLEEERTVSRQLRTELGQARSELEVAAAARAEATAMEAELEAARRELREAQRRHEQATEALSREHDEAMRELARRHEQAAQEVTREHDRLAQTQAVLQQELRETTAALESAREALAAERAEAGRLRHRGAQAQEGGRQRPTTPPDGPAEPRVTRRPASPARREADPSTTQRFDVLGLEEGLATGGASAPKAAPPLKSSSRRAATHYTVENPTWAPPSAADRLRPVNPSLRHSTWWFGRLLALLVLLGVIAAVWIVLHSTVLH